MGEETAFITRMGLREDALALGIAPGDMIMVHAAMSKVGPMLNGPDALIGGLLDAVGHRGTIMAYADWDARYHGLLDEEGRVPEQWRPHIPPFDPLRSRAIRDNGVLPEFLRTWPEARRSGNPGASMVAIGASAEWLTENHPLDYGYGEGSPLAKLVQANGKVLMVSAPLDTMTLLHHAEHLARIPGKRIRHCEVPLQGENGVHWRMSEEFDTGDPIVEGLAGDYFAEIVETYLAQDAGRRGLMGQAPSVLVDASAIVAFAVHWLESRFAPRATHIGPTPLEIEGGDL